MPRLAAAAVAATAAGAARRVPGVAGLDAGPLGTKVTYGGGGRVAGVTVRHTGGGRCVTLHLVVEWGPVRPTADAARAAALAALQDAYPDAGPWVVDADVVDVEVADLATGAVADLAAGAVEGGP